MASLRRWRHHNAQVLALAQDSSSDDGDHMVVHNEAEEPQLDMADGDGNSETSSVAAAEVTFEEERYDSADSYIYSTDADSEDTDDDNDRVDLSLTDKLRKWATDN